MSRSSEHHIRHSKNDLRSRRAMKNDMYLPYWALIALAICIIYFAVHIFRLNDHRAVSSYQVISGSNSTSNIYSAVILRDETIFLSPMDGYMNYYTKNGERIGANSIVCTMDAKGDFFKKMEEEMKARENNELSEDTLKGFQEVLSRFNQNFDIHDYSELYYGKYDITNDLMDLMNTDIYNLISKNSKGEAVFDMIKTTTPGIIMFSYDNYTDLKQTEVNDSLFNKSKYELKKIAAGSFVESGTPLYRVVKSDAFSVIFPLQDSDKLQYFLSQKISIIFKEQGVTLEGAYTHFTGADGKSYARVDFSGNGYPFLNTRFVNIQIAESNISGFKIPVGAVTEKEYFAVPKDYVNTSKATPYLMVYTDTGELSKRQVSIIRSTDDEYIISVSDVEKGDELYYKPDEDVVPAASDAQEATTNLRYRLFNTQKIKGVYNIDRGYTVFKPIEIIYTTGDGYYIIDKDAPFTVKEYERISNNAADYEEGDFVY